MARLSLSVTKGRGHMSHNNREIITENVDPARTHLNITYCREPIEEAYEKLFGEEITRYNQGKKPCRQISNYLDHIKQSKNGEKQFYEVVVQVGNMQDCGYGTKNFDMAGKVLDEYMKNFQKNNPNLYVFNAVLHMDEKTPHLHIDYIPIARGYKNGLQVRNSLDKALKQQGIDGKSSRMDNSTLRWQEREKDTLEAVLNQYGHQRMPETGLKRQHMSVNQYKTIAEQVHNEVKNMPKQIETAPMMLNKERVTVAKTDLENLEKRARLSLVHEKATKELEKQMTERSNNIAVTENKLTESLENAEKARQEYEKLHAEQQELRVNYVSLLAEHYEDLQTIEEQKEVISALKAENSSLRAEIEERVQKAVEPLKRQISSLTARLEGMARCFTNALKAVGMLCHHSGAYKADLTGEQRLLLDATVEYGRDGMVKGLGNTDLADELAEEIDTEVGISKGITAYMSPKKPEVLYFKGGKNGKGFYSKDGKFFGTADKLSDLKSNGYTIKDPYDLLPTAPKR